MLYRNHRTEITKKDDTALFGQWAAACLKYPMLAFALNICLSATCWLSQLKRPYNLYTSPFSVKPDPGIPVFKELQKSIDGPDLLAVTFQNPMMTMILSVGTTLDLMAVTAKPITAINQVRNSFIRTVAMSDSIHLLTAFSYQYGKTKDKLRAIISALETPGLAITMTTIQAESISGFSRSPRLELSAENDRAQSIPTALTHPGKALTLSTATLLCSFRDLLLSNMKNLFDFGLVGSFTICAALIIDLSLSPSLLTLIDKKKALSRKNASPATKGIPA